LKLSNEFGTEPVLVGSVHIAVHGKDSGIVEGTDRAVSFGGNTSVTIPAGALMLSDPVNLNVPKLTEVAISLYFPKPTGPATTHLSAFHTTYVSKAGDLTGALTISDASTTQSWYWISGLDVLATANASAIVTLGDSITDGTRSTPDTNSSWPNVLASRLVANSQSANLAVVNEGISGNRLLHDIAGPNALARFDRDVLSQPGLKWVTVLEGINDIGRSDFGPNPEPVTSDELIGAFKQMIERAHTHGIKVAGCTILPYAGAAYFNEKGETVRSAVNQWIRTSHAFDAVIDFDSTTRDPANPRQMRAEFDSGDHLHPNDAGYKAMAESIDLSIFTRR
jgi:lysophospholipase L1-like esterase